MSPNSISFKSFSKVNLGLKILDLLPDNYHSIFTIMQEIDLHVTINFKKNLEKKINFSTDGAIIVPNDKTNLCYKAAKLILENYKTSSGINIHLTKNIPIGAGLGGGSSNAATVLLALNDIFNLKINSLIKSILVAVIATDNSDICPSIVSNHASSIL